MPESPRHLHVAFEAAVARAADKGKITAEQEDRIVATDVILQAQSRSRPEHGVGRGRGGEPGQRSGTTYSHPQRALRGPFIGASASARGVRGA